MPVGTDEHCETLRAMRGLELAACILIHRQSERLRRSYTALDDRRRPQEAGQPGLCAELGQVCDLRAIFRGGAIRDQHVLDAAQHVEQSQWKSHAAAAQAVAIGRAIAGEGTNRFPAGARRALDPITAAVRSPVPTRSST
jgi:hypothetical protein